MKKKILTLILASLLSVTVVGCNPIRRNNSDGSTTTSSQSKKSDKISFDELNVVKDFCEYKFVEAEAAKRIEPSIPDSYYTYYDSKTDGNVLVKVAFDVKNLTSDTQYLEDFMTAKMGYSNDEYATTCIAEKADGTDFEIYPEIDSLSTKRIIFLAEVPEAVSKEEIKLKLTINNKEYSTLFKVDDYKQEKVTKKIGDTLSNDNCEITLNSLEFKDRIEPSAPGSYYSYYDVKDASKTYLVLKASVKNLKGSEVEADKVAGVSAVYNDKYNYKSAPIVEEADRSDLTSGTIVSLQPLETRTMYYLIEVPKETKDGSIEVIVNIAGQKYYINK